MKAFRTTIFWLHLGAGIFAGVVVLIMSLTGVLLMYEKQMIEWADRGYRASPPSAAAQRAPIETLLARASEAKGALPTMVTLRSDAAAPVAFGFGRESTTYVNPYSGEVLGEGSRGIREFFQVVTAWHRWLGAEAENRPLGKAVTGACNLAFLFIVISGPYLWWPRQWTWNNLKAVTLFRTGLRGRARDFNWHNVLGLWCCVPLFFVILGATVISYPWATDLVYRAVGEEPPARGGPAGAAGSGRPGGPGSERGGDQRPGPRDAHQTQQTVTGLTEPAPSAPAKGSSSEATPAAVATRKESGGPRPGGDSREAEGRPKAEADAPAGRNQPAATLNLQGLDQLFTRAEKQVAGWRTISLRLPGSQEEPLSFLIDQGAPGQPHLRSTLVLDPHTSNVVQWETFSDASRGRRIRMLLRFLHTGEVAGIPGQTLAGIASAGAVVLVYTGFALAWRRFRAWLARRRSRASNQVLAEG